MSLMISDKIEGCVVNGVFIQSIPSGYEPETSIV